MSCKEVTKLHFCDVVIKAKNYEKILENVMKPSAQKLFNTNNNFYYQDVNAPMHTADSVKRYLRKQVFQRISCSPQSPDNVDHRDIMESDKSNLY